MPPNLERSTIFPLFLEVVAVLPTFLEREYSCALLGAQQKQQHSDNYTILSDAYSTAVPAVPSAWCLQ
jgi:hypothetical protein